jgi:hypothetical protein
MIQNTSRSKVTKNKINQVKHEENHLHLVCFVAIKNEKTTDQQCYVVKKAKYTERERWVTYKKRRFDSPWKERAVSEVKALLERSLWRSICHMRSDSQGCYSWFSSTNESGKKHFFFCNTAVINIIVASLDLK